MHKYNNSVNLITGGTGSFGKRFVQMTLDKQNPRKVIVLSKNKMNQWEMTKLYKGDGRLKDKLPHFEG